MRRLISGLLAIWVTLSASGLVQAEMDRPTEVAPKVATTVESLEALLKAIENREADVAEVQDRLKVASDEVTRADLLERLGELKEQGELLRSQFEQFAVAVDTRLFGDDEPEKKFDWQEELGSLVRPIIAELKSATAESRAIGELRGEIQALEKKSAIAAEGVENLQALVAANPSPALRDRLTKRLEAWQRRLDDARNQRTALKLQLENRLAERESLLDETTAYARSFFQERGLNLVYGALAFLGVFFFVRLLNHLLGKASKRQDGQSFASRLGTLVLHLLSVLGGLLAALVVLNMVGDWFLLGILVIFLLGVGWASIKTLPQYVETVTLILNVGAVREGERIVFDGLPWRVESLGFAARLVNPELEGGAQRLPVKLLIGRHSRPNGEHEAWFPCRHGDWVELGDGNSGRVASQTPSTVRLVERGGSQVVYQTPDFLALSPRALSAGFRIQSTFGVDYKHQSISTTEIPEKMQAALETGLPQVVEAAWIKGVRVELMAAGASSLDYAIEADFHGEAAAQHPRLERAISRLLVEACSQYGWEIPFTQVTLHQAQAESSKPSSWPMRG